MFGLVLKLFDKLLILQHCKSRVGSHLVASHTEEVAFEFVCLLVHLFTDEIDRLELFSVLVSDLALLLLFSRLKL
jgi:hypothetical protein